jgi:DNA-binding winged helix-turn-helix (wHTH) protein
MLGTIRCEFAGFTFQPDGYLLERPDKEIIRFSNGLGELLLYFIKNQGSDLSIDELIENVKFKFDEEVSNNAVSKRVAHLRREMEGDSRSQNIIETVRGGIYRFKPKVKTVELIDRDSLSVILETQHADKDREIKNLKRENQFLERENQILRTQNILFMLASLTEPERAQRVFDIVRWSNQRLFGPEQEIHLRTLEMIGDHIEATLSHYRQESSNTELELAVEMSRFWNSRGLFSKGCTFLQGALSRHTEATSDSQAMGSAWLSNLSFHLGDYEAAKQSAMKSINISKQIGNDEASAIALFTLGMIEGSKGNYSESRRVFNDCSQISQRLGLKWLGAWTFSELGILARDQENYGFAQSWFSKSSDEREAIGDAHGIAIVQGHLSAVTCAQGDLEQAMIWADKSMVGPVSRTVSARYYSNLGSIEEEARNYLAAFGYFQKSFILHLETGQKLGQARCLEAMAKVRYLLNDERESASLFGLAYKIRTCINAPLSPAERKAYGSLITEAEKKYLTEFEKGSERLGDIVLS